MGALRKLKDRDTEEPFVAPASEDLAHRFFPFRDPDSDHGVVEVNRLRFVMHEAMRRVYVVGQRDEGWIGRASAALAREAYRMGVSVEPSFVPFLELLPVIRESPGR